MKQEKVISEIKSFKTASLREAEMLQKAIGVIPEISGDALDPFNPRKYEFIGVNEEKANKILKGDNKP